MRKASAVHYSRIYQHMNVSAENASEQDTPQGLPAEDDEAPMAGEQVTDAMPALMGPSEEYVTRAPNEQGLGRAKFTEGGKL